MKLLQNERNTIAALLIISCVMGLTGCAANDPSAKVGQSTGADTADAALYEVEASSAAASGSADDIAPTPTPKPTPKLDTVRLSCAGDCTLGTDPKFNYSSSFNAMVKRVKNKAYFFKNMQKYFASDDMTLVNFEGTLTTRTTPSIKKFTFKGPPSYINIIKKGNIEALAFANNHCRDYGEGSYYDSIDTFKKAKVKYSSYSKVCTYTVKKKKTGTKIKIGMISVNGLEGYEAARSLIASGVKKLKKKKCKLIIMSMHAGVERQYYPNQTQISLAHYAVDCGCSLVLGHHPHVIQGAEKYKGVFIVYSLGNFCFGGNSNPTDKDTMIAVPIFKFKNGRLLKKQTRLKLIPCCVSSTTSYNNYQPTPKKGSEKKRVLAKLNKMCEALGTTLRSDLGKLTVECRKK
ncbi:MAG: CapA family protein [Eubacterium sp.]|nr:CapA family protein [Eubacterium sp.]